MRKFDWQANKTLIVYNPRLSPSRLIKAKEFLQNYQSCICLPTSGTKAENPFSIKWVILSINSILCSAKSVNNFLSVTSGDHWVHALPDFHVGGIGIWARAFLGGNSVHDLKENGDYKWNPKIFTAEASRTQATLTALVPAQIYDIVSHQLQAPPFLRAVIVGGGALSPSLYIAARKLGWNVLPSYGLTECSSQVATASLQTLNELNVPEKWQILSHVKVTVDKDKRFVLKSAALLKCYIFQEENNFNEYDPKIDHSFHTEDTGEVGERYIIFNGRIDDMVKISGELVLIKKLEAILDELKIKNSFQDDLAMIAVPDQRLGYTIQLAANRQSENLQKIIDQYNEIVLPYERIKAIHFVPQIPRTALGKTIHRELLKLLKCP